MGAADALTQSSDTLVIDAAVVSLATLQKQLSGHKTIQVAPKSIITPAVKDFCREKGISIVRGESVAKPSSEIALISDSLSKPARPQRLIVVGGSDAMDAVAKQLCPKQARVLATVADDSAAVRAALEGLQSGHQAAVLWSDTPFATNWQASRIDSLRPAMVSQWSELGQAIREVPLNLLILPKQNWSLPAFCNASRSLFEHLKRNS